MKTFIVSAAFGVLFMLISRIGEMPTLSSGWWSWAVSLLKDSAAVLCLSASAYACKRRLRLLYGIGELVIFVLSAMAFLLGLIQGDQVPPDWANWRTSAMLLGGMITVALAGVRGLDDIGEGLSGWWKEKWDWVFPKKENGGK